MNKPEMTTLMFQRKISLVNVLLICTALLPSLSIFGQPPPIPFDPAASQNSPGRTLPTMVPPRIEKTGLLLKQDGVSDGYTLIATRGSTSTYLINNDGFIVHTWTHQKITGMCAYLLPNGNLLHTVRNSPDEVGDIVQELTWDGDIVWQYDTDRAVQQIHHDIERLPNGNTLITVWERKDEQEYTAKGRNPNTVLNNEMWVDAIHEIQPTGKTSGKVVWRWAAWDHLIQNYSENCPDYGDPAEHPNRIDLNQNRSKGHSTSDWLHINAVDYHPARDEIMLSVHSFGEMWILSKKTGALIYRWGNPQRYGNGDESDQVLFLQHDLHWIKDGLPGAGNILVYNNDHHGFKGMMKFSGVLELKPPLTDTGAWPAPNQNGVYPDCEMVWKHTGEPVAMFYSPMLSSAQRLKNGGTLICAGLFGNIFELDALGKRVWHYNNPIVYSGPGLKRLENWNKPPPGNGSAIFRAYKYPLDYSAFTGKNLSPKELLGGPVAK